MLEAHDGDLYGMDLLAVGAVNRSKALSAGFSQLIKSKNMLSAGALLRLELDTVLRFSAAWLVEDPHAFALAVLGGKKVRDLKDQSGRKMTDAYLVRRLEGEYPWIPRVYERTSGYVHFSSVHVLATITLNRESEEQRGFWLKLSNEDKPLPVALYVEATEAFSECAKILLKYVHGWTFTKGNPEEVARMKRERGLD